MSDSKIREYIRFLENTAGLDWDGDFALNEVSFDEHGVVHTDGDVVVGYDLNKAELEDQMKGSTVNFGGDDVVHEGIWS